MPRILTGAGILVALLAPALTFAAYNDVTLTVDQVALSVNGITLNVSGSSATIESITVNAADFSVTLGAGSSFQVEAPGLEQLNASSATDQTGYTCNNSQSLIKFESAAGGTTVTITPSTTLCSSGNSGGGNSTSGGSSTTVSSTPATPATPAATTTPAVTTTPTTTTTTTTTSTSGLSASQIQSILDVLASFDVDAATMASVKAALGATTTGSVTSAAVHVFKANLTTGSLGSEVKALQQFLNSHGYTIANSGAGSPGNETTKFGGLTKAALIKYQKAKGITPAVGYFGAKTRASVNAE